eukprot:UN34428
MVNAANELCLGGAGVDGAVCRMGGRRLDNARRKLPLIRRGVRCETGSAVITIGGDLLTKWCIHAVGPRYFVSRNSEEVTDKYCDTLLYNAYVESLKLASKHKCRTIAFCLLSAGIFKAHRSLMAVLALGFQAIIDTL